MDDLCIEKRDSPAFSFSVAIKKDKKGYPSNKHKSPVQEEEIEINFQGIERVQHVEDPPIKLPKIVESAIPELTVNTTAQEKSFTEHSYDRSNTDSKLEAYEKPKCRAVIQYTFFSKKLGGEYVIKSTDLFQVEEMKQKL